MNNYGKWGKAYWADLAERVGTTLVYAVITALTVVGTTPVDWSDPKVIWAVIGLPTALSLLKGLAMNLGGNQPTASVVNVTSTGE
jgi:hypothetical protein